MQFIGLGNHLEVWSEFELQKNQEKWEKDYKLNAQTFFGDFPLNLVA